MAKTKIFITGGSGFIGKELIKDLSGYSLKVLSRKNTGDRKFIQGDLMDKDQTLRALSGCDIVVHLAFSKVYDENLRMIENLIYASKKSKVKRFILISSMSAKRSHPDAYGKIKQKIEEQVHRSSLPYTILRPSIIYGKGSTSFDFMINMMKKVPLMTPIFGSGLYSIYPVYIGDVVDAIVSCIENKKTVCKEYDLAGASKIFFIDLVNKIKAQKDIKKINIHIPLMICKMFSSMFPKIVSKENIKNLTEDSLADISEAKKDFGYDPMTLEEGKDMVSYKKILSSSMLKKPIRSIASTWSTYRQGEYASLPFKLKMESAAICNFKCTMCPLHIGLKRNQGFLKFGDFKKVFDEVKPAYLNLTGIGEPLMNKDLFKIVSYAKNRRAMVKLDTNASLLSQDTIDKLLATKIDIISMSIDGADKVSYEKIRVGGNFSEMKKNAANLVRTRDSLRSDTQIHMFFVLQEKNLTRLPKLIALGDSLGIDYIAGSFVVPLGKNRNKVNKLSDKKKTYESIIKETREVIKNANAEVSVGPLLEYLTSSENKEQYNSEKPCFMPWYSAFVTWDGFVNPCDFSCDNEITFGNAFQEPFKKIWNGPKIRAFRNELRSDRQNIPLCKGCGVDETYLLKEIDFLKKIPLLNRFRKNA